MRLFALLLVAGAAHAYDSKCYVHGDLADPDPALAEPECAEGPQAARNRWVGVLDEHRQFFETSRALAGLPEEVSEAVAIRVFTGSDPVDVAGAEAPSLVPVAFWEAERVQTRRFTAGELAQLPDFSYALWDWALGNETCPLPGLAIDAAACHGFKSHMGAVNSNHFLPQAGSFYARTHGLAVARAGECATMRDALGDDAHRFERYLKACEHEALSIEAFAHHYLQDAWSMGHMWTRWGSPDLDDFVDDAGAVDRRRAVLVALSAGIIHGARGVLQSQLPAWSGLDVNDAMCAPRDGVEWRDGRGLGRAAGLGDDYLDQIATPGFADQYEQAFSCATSGLIEVYQAAGAHHGELDPPAAGLRLIDPSSSMCLGQRATNQAMHHGMGLDWVDPLGNQRHIAMDGRTLTNVLLAGASAFGGGVIPGPLRDRYRVDMARITSAARIWAQYLPLQTDLAEGEIGALVGVETNDHFDDKTPLATYVDPQLPWPGTADADTPDAAARATALARLFHRGHAADWCAEIGAEQLDALRARADDDALDVDARAAACEACTEFAERHLRVGSGVADYDDDAEPLCHFLTDDPAYLYEPARGDADTTALARTWCGCGEALVLTGEGVVRILYDGPAVARIEPAAPIPVGDRPRDLAVTGRDGGRAVVTNFGDGTVTVLSLERGRERALATIDVGPSPRGVAITNGGGYALVAVSGSDEVVVIDLETHALCKRFDVGQDPATNEFVDSVVISRNNLTAYVSLTGSARTPGEAVAILDMLHVLDCEAPGDEVAGYLEDLGGDPRPGALALSPDGALLAIAGRGNERLMVIDTATHETLDLLPDVPARRFIRTAQFPWDLTWSSDGERIFYGHIGGDVGSRLELNGTVRIGTLATGRDSYDVGVAWPVRALVADADDAWIYVADSRGGITALSVDLWDGAAEHVGRPLDGTGGCLDDRGRATACPAALDLGVELRALVSY